MTRARALGGATSVALHAFLLAAMLYLPPATSQRPQRGQEERGVALLPSPQPILSGGQGRGLACGGRRYNGLGFADLYGEVVTIGSDTPAARAGLELGDRVIAPTDLAADAYPTNTRLQVRVRRAGRVVTLAMTVESICQEPEIRRRAAPSPHA